MKKTFLIATTAALMLSAPAFAADDNSHHASHASNYGHGKPPATVYRENHSNYGKGKPASEVYHQNHTYGAGESPSEVYHNNHSGAYAASHSTINFNRRNVSASHQYHYSGGGYHGPSGYSYRRWSYGESLPSIYFSQNYWIGDYGSYGLAPPPGGAVWVRYGPDALLIDESTGEILETVYGQFY